MALPVAIWTDEEKEALRGLLPLGTVARITEAYNELAKEKGWPPRTKTALFRKTREVGKPAGCHGRYHWTHAESDYLQSLAGEYPFELLVRHYRAWASEKGFPPRTLKALALRLRTLEGGSRLIPVGEWITTATICDLLGVSQTTVARWVNSGKLRCSTMKIHADKALGQRSKGGGKRKRYYNRRELQSFAKAYPELLAGCSRENLFALLDHQSLADEISEQRPFRINQKGHPVLCVETGKRFDSYVEAARWLSKQSGRRYSRHLIHQAAKKGHRAGQFHWKPLQMTLEERAQTLADSQERTWYVVTDRNGGRFISPNLSDVANSTGHTTIKPRIPKWKEKTSCSSNSSSQKPSSAPVVLSSL